MPSPNEFTLHCCELLAPLGPVRAHRMFSGHGLYVDDLFVALLADEQLWLKSDALSRPSFEAAGCPPFRYQRKGEWAQLGFHRPPEEAMDSPALMQPWARLALQAALRAHSTKLSKPARPPASKQKRRPPI